jgi:hypothetical protein
MAESSEEKYKKKLRQKQPKAYGTVVGGEDPIDVNIDVNNNVNENVDKNNPDQTTDPVKTNNDVNENVDVTSSVRRKRKRKKFEETHTRATFYIENHLLAKLDQEAGTEKGEKTRIVNEALAEYLYRKK